MVIIRCNVPVDNWQADKLIKDIHEQAKAGVIVLPHFCELLNDVPADEKIKVVYKQKTAIETARDAEEFSRRLMERLCSTCKERYAPPSLKPCWGCSSGSLYRKE